jgi:hypothetical protein
MSSYAASAWARAARTELAGRHLGGRATWAVLWPYSGFAGVRLLDPAADQLARPAVPDIEFQ